MRTKVLDVTLPRVVLTRFLGCLWKGACVAPTSALNLVDLPEPRLPAPDWVRVRSRLCGICGSDLHQFFLDTSLDIAPVASPSHKRVYLGHEMVGEVVEAGEAVTDIKVGERVVRRGRGDDCLARDHAELCAACDRGHRVLCDRASEPREYEPVGGGFGDTFIAPVSTLLRVPTDLPDALAIFAEPAAVAIHAAWRRWARAGEQVLVIGCGTIGFLLIRCESYSRIARSRLLPSSPGRQRWPEPAARITLSWQGMMALPRLPGSQVLSSTRVGPAIACC